MSIPDSGNLPPKTSVNICGAAPPKPPSAFVNDPISPPCIAPKAPPIAPAIPVSRPRGPARSLKAPTVSPFAIDCNAPDNPPKAAELPEKSTSHVNAAA